MSHRATNKGVSLKNYIELIVEQAAEQEEDEILIELSSQPEGILTGKEKEQFKKYLQSLRGE